MGMIFPKKHCSICKYSTVHDKDEKWWIKCVIFGCLPWRDEMHCPYYKIFVEVL